MSRGREAEKPEENHKIIVFSHRSMISGTANASNYATLDTSNHFSIGQVFIKALIRRIDYQLINRLEDATTGWVVLQ